MQDSPQQGCAFGGFRLEPDGTLFRGQAVVHLPPRELAALRFLLAHAGQLVTPLQLRQELWGDLHVTDDSVPKCISSLRARLEPEMCIQTVYKRGYRFSAEVRPHGVDSSQPPRLAILPFVTVYGVPEYLGPALAEETVARLVNCRGALFSVLARDSVFTLAQRGIPAQQLGKMLNADLVLMGTLRALPAHFRLRAEMIRVEDDTQLWVEDLLVPQNNMAVLESELVERLLLRLGQGAPVDLSASPENGVVGLSLAAAAGPAVEIGSNPQQREAYDLLLRARYECQSLHRHRMQDGLQQLLHAVELDPKLTPAHLEIARVCVLQAFYGYMPPVVAADQVRRAAQSIAAFPDAVEAIQPAMGWIGFHVDRDLPAALQAFSQSAHLPPDPFTTRLYTLFALSRHRFTEAIDLLQAALRQDPVSPLLLGRLAWTLHLRGQAGESMQPLRRALATSPQADIVAFYGSMILACNGEEGTGEQLARQLTQSKPDCDLVTAAHAFTLACSGRRDEAHVLLERLQWLSRERFVSASFLPAVYVALGDHDAALAALRTAEEARCPWFFQMLADPRLKPLRVYPEFARMRAILTGMEAAAANLPQAEHAHLQAALQ